MNNNTDILIEQYLAGQLTGEALRQFEQQLQTNPALAEQMKQYRHMDQYLDHKAKVPELQQQLESLSGKYFGEEPPASGPNRRPWIIASVMVLALVILAILLFFRNQTPPSYQQYAQHFPLSITSQSSTASATIATLEQAFNQEEYTRLHSFV
jgi:anti-sigma factor RsiW